MGTRIIRKPLREIETACDAILSGVDGLVRVASPPSSNCCSEDNVSLVFLDKKHLSTKPLSADDLSFCPHIEVHLNAIDAVTTRVKYQTVEHPLLVAKAVAVGLVGNWIMMGAITKFVSILAMTAKLRHAHPMIFAICIACILGMALGGWGTLHPLLVGSRRQRTEHKFWTGLENYITVSSEVERELGLATENFNALILWGSLVLVYSSYKLAITLALPPVLVICSVTVFLYGITRTIWSQWPSLAFRAWVMTKCIGFIPTLIGQVLGIHMVLAGLVSLMAWNIDRLAWPSPDGSWVPEVKDGIDHKGVIYYTRNPTSILRMTSANWQQSQLSERDRQPDRFGYVLRTLGERIASERSLPGLGMTIIGCIALACAITACLSMLYAISVLRGTHKALEVMAGASLERSENPAWLPDENPPRWAQSLFTVWATLGWMLYIAWTAFLVGVGWTFFSWAVTGHVFTPLAVELMPYTAVEQYIEAVGWPRHLLIAMFAVFIGIPLSLLLGRCGALILTCARDLMAMVASVFATPSRGELLHLRGTTCGIAVRTDPRLLEYECGLSFRLWQPEIQVSPELYCVLEGKSVGSMSVESARALVAHEVGHLACDPWTPALRAAGAFCLVGPTVASVLVDYREVEVRADSYATGVVGNDFAAAIATMRASLHNTKPRIHRAAPWPFWRLQRSYAAAKRTLASLFCADLGLYFHPRPAFACARGIHDHRHSGEDCRSQITATRWRVITGAAIGSGALAALGAGLIRLSL